MLLLLGTLYVASNLLTPVAQDLGISLTGRKFFGEWVAAIAMGVAVDPIVAVTAVVLALELMRSKALERVPENGREDWIRSTSACGSGPTRQSARRR